MNAEFFLRRKLENVQQVDKHNEAELKQIKTYFKNLTDGYQIIGNAQKEKLEDILDTSGLLNGEYELVGIPGTFFEAITLLSFSITQLFAEVNKEAKEINTTITGTIDTLDTLRKKNITQMDRDIENAILKLSSIDNGFKGLSQIGSMDCQEFSTQTTKLLNTRKPSKKDMSKYQDLFHKIITYRQQMNKEKIMLVISAQNAIDSSKKSMETFKTSIKERNVALKEIFKWVYFIYNGIVNKMQTCTTNIRECAQKLDITSDLSRHIKYNKIVRYDIPMKEFKRIEISDPAFQGVKKIPKEISPVYPVGMARIVQSFDGSGPNEINCRKGKYALLMEKPDLDWCCVMHPVTHRTGFIPSYCVEAISNTFGIIIRNPEGDFKLSIGDFVAITDDSNSASYEVETAFGEKGTLSRSVIGLLSL